MRDGRSSAVAATAASAAPEGGNQGCLAAHTDAAGVGAQPDLLREAFEADVGLFEDAAIPAPKPRGRGRPAGSPNRTTTKLKHLLLERGYRDPAEFLAALMTMDTSELAAEMGCKEKLEALKVQRQAASDLMPYFHQRMPQEAEQRPAEARPLVMIVEGGAKVSVAKDDGTFSVLDVEPNQQVSDEAPRGSHDGGSHDEG